MRLLNMHGTLEVTDPRPFPSLLSARRFFTVSARPNVWDSCKRLGKSRIGASPGNGLPAILAPIFTPDVVWPCIRVAYSLLALSRLEYSPNLALDGAYHTTSCKSRIIANLCRDKKSGALHLSASVKPLRRVAAPTSLLAQSP